MTITINGNGTISGLTSSDVSQVNASSKVLVGGPTTSTYGWGLQTYGNTTTRASDIMGWRFSPDTNSAILGLFKTRGATASDTTTPVQTNDFLGAIGFYGSVGSAGITSYAAINGFVDGTVSSSPVTLDTAISISTSATERFRVGSSGEVSIQKKILVGGPTTSTSARGIQAYGSAGTQNILQWTFSNSTTGSDITLVKTRGTTATATDAVQSGDNLGSMGFAGADGTTGNVSRAAITGVVDGAVSTGVVPTAITFTTGTSSGTQQMVITSAGRVGIGTGTPDASAKLEVNSTTQGVKFPNMTTIQRNAISTPGAGLVIFDLTLSKLCVYTGAAWERITSAV